MDEPKPGTMRRRHFLGAAAAAAGAGALGEPTESLARAERPKPPLGSGGAVMSLDALHELARREGKGSPILILDLAALDANLATIRAFAAGQGWDVRPALKSFRSPELCGYVMRSLARPLGLIFALREADAVVAASPRNTDLMTGWAPTYGELAGYLRKKPPPKQRRHRMRILIDSVPLMRELARLARNSPRPLPIEVALELDVGMGRGGISDRTELADCLAILRVNRDRLQLSAVIGYDGHATLDGNDAYRAAVAAQAQVIFRLRLAELAGLGAGLYDERTLVRNGPGSSNYHNWVGGPINEISPGSAFMRARYLDTGFDQDGLAYALTFAGAVRRVTSDHPSVPVTGTTVPGATQEEIIVQAMGPPDEIVRPDGVESDALSGGPDALVIPKGSIGLGDYVLYRPHQLEPAIVNFDQIVAVRNGKVRRRWIVPPRPGG